MAKPNLRSEIQALRNQAKARGHDSKVSNEELKKKAFTHNESDKSTHKYVYRDIFRTFLFLLVALIILFLASVKMSSLLPFEHARQALHITQFSF